MAGLLEGLAVIGSGIAGSAKMAGDTFSEQLKQDALAARETNMARINSIYAKEARTETIQAQERMQKTGFTHAEKLQKESIRSVEDMAARASEERAVEGVFERGSRETLNYESNKAADLRQEKANQQALDLYKIQSDAVLKAAELAGKKAESLVRLEANLRNAAPDDITKKVAALSKIMDPKEAVSLVVNSYSGNKDKAKLYGDFINKTLANDNLNGVKQTPERLAEIKSAGEDLFDYHPKKGAPAQAGEATKPINYLDRAFQKASGKAPGAKPSTAPAFDNTEMAWDPTQGMGLLGEAMGDASENPLVRSIANDQMNKLKEYKPR